MVILPLGWYLPFFQTWTQDGYFPKGNNSGFFEVYQKYISRRVKSEKFHFIHSKLRKRHFFYKFSEKMSNFHFQGSFPPALLPTPMFQKSSKYSNQPVLLAWSFVSLQSIPIVFMKRKQQKRGWPSFLELIEEHCII